MSNIQVVVNRRTFNASGKAQRRKLREYAIRPKKEPFLGTKIKRKSLPKKYRNLPNLFRLKLPGGWRALYTVASSPTHGTQVRILWIGNHAKYNRLFGF